MIQTSIPIGYEGEYNARSYPIDISDLLYMHPNGVPVLMVQRPGENSVYPAVNTTLENGHLVWHFSAYDAAIKGIGKAQVELIDAKAYPITPAASTNIINVKTSALRIFIILR